MCTMHLTYVFFEVEKVCQYKRKGRSENKFTKGILAH